MEYNNEEINVIDYAMFELSVNFDTIVNKLSKPKADKFRMMYSKFLEETETLIGDENVKL
jgi:hypothetical protein